MTLKERFESDWKYHNENSLRLAKTHLVIESLGLQDESGYTYQGSFEVYARDAEHARELARNILPMVGKLDKTINEYSGSLELKGAHLGVEITIRYAPPEGCTITEVKEEVTEPARTFTRRKFVAVGDCSPLLSE